MRKYWTKIFPPIAFLGTAIGFVWGNNRVKLTLGVVCVSFVLILMIDSFKNFQVIQLKMLKWFVIVITPGVLFNIFTGYDPFISIIQLIGITVFWIVSWAMLTYLSFSPDLAFSVYLQSAKYAAFVGVLQQVAFQLKLEPLWDLRWLLIGAAEPTFSGDYLRVSSLFTEPSYFAVFLIPALYCSVMRLTGSSKLVSLKSSLLFIFALINTFSTIGFIGLILCVLVATKFTARHLAIVSLLVISLFVIMITDAEISARLFLNSIGVFDIQESDNLSVFNNKLNLNLSLAMIADHPFFGLGLGAYSDYSLEYLREYLSDNFALEGYVNDIISNLTLADGGSMYLRLLVEVGVPGCILFIILIGCSNKLTLSARHHDISNATLLFFAVFCIRSGQLIRFEFIFFCALYSLILYGPKASSLVDEGVKVNNMSIRNKR